MFPNLADQHLALSPSTDRLDQTSDHWSRRKGMNR